MLLRVNIFLVTAALVFLQVAGMAVPDELEKDIGEIVEPRIVGGHPAKKTQFPFVVSLRSKTSYNFSNGHFCGGTIISKSHILTSAHCASIIKPNPSLFYVTAGSTYLKDKRIKKYEIKSIVTHEDYNPYTVANDVGLITLAKKVRFSKKYIKAKKIVRRVPKSGVKCFISGWGTYGGNDYFYHDRLMFAKVPISDTKYCVAQYSGAVNPKTMICAGLKKGGVDTCSGDLGGPLICNKGIAGIASWGRVCGQPGYPGVYANAHTYIPWLKRHTKGLFYSDDEVEEDDSGEYDDSHETEAEENLKTPENVSANEESVNDDETEHQDISGLLAAQQ